MFSEHPTWYPTDALTELFSVWDAFPIYHSLRSNKPFITIGHDFEKHIVAKKLHHPNYIKRALYYQKLLENGYVQSQRELAKIAGISQTQTNFVLKLLTLDEEITDFILNLDDEDPLLSFLAVYRLLPLLHLTNKDERCKLFRDIFKAL